MSDIHHHIHSCGPIPPNKDIEMMCDMYIHFQTPMWICCLGNDWPPNQNNETMSDIHHHIHSRGPTVLGMTNLLTKTQRWCMTSMLEHSCGSAVLEMTDLLMTKRRLTSTIKYSCGSCIIILLYIHVIARQEVTCWDLCLSFRPTSQSYASQAFKLTNKLCCVD